MAESLKLEVLDPPADSRHRFAPIRYNEDDWDLTHLDSFAFKADIGFEVTVVVIFSCHCFSHSVRWDTRPQSEIPEAEIYRDDREESVLDPLRYHLSKTLLRELVIALPSRHIIVANVKSRNFLTWEMQAKGGKQSIYAVFFDVEKDQRRGQRLILRVQSAYLLDQGLTRRQKDAKKVRLVTLLKAAYAGRTINP
ncbi:hypothetical protein [Burkholderia guangdongensis]|uniref:hypothetical protein n=1 Tax=Burkholderia guangdongensis TaxID=1792500 RepID=UPI0015CC6213|nr:hypothetical protein [Burkholderia guangdongensis]